MTCDTFEMAISHFKKRRICCAILSGRIKPVCTLEVSELWDIIARVTQVAEVVHLDLWK